MAFYHFTSTVMFLALVMAMTVTAQRTTKKPNVPDFEDRYISNPFTQEEFAALGGGGSVGVVPPSDTQGGGGSSGGVFVPPVDTTTTRRTTTTTEDFSSLFLGNQQQPNNNQQQPGNNFNQGRPDSLPNRPVGNGNGNERPVWNSPTQDIPRRRFRFANRRTNRFNF